MRILSISKNHLNFSFAQSATRRPETDRAVTVQDLYEMEDRINKHNEKLIKEQNEKLGQTLQSMIHHINCVGALYSDEEYDEAMDNATLLKLNA